MPPSFYTDFTQIRPESGIEIISEFIPGTDDHCVKLNFAVNNVFVKDILQVDEVEQQFTHEKRTALWRFDVAKANISYAVMSEHFIDQTAEINIPKSLQPRKVAIQAISDSPIARFYLKNIELTEGRCGEVKPMTEAPPTPATFTPSKLDKATLEVAEELMKNSRSNVERILELIKIDDPIKKVVNEVLAYIINAQNQIALNLK